MLKHASIAWDAHTPEAPLAELGCFTDVRVGGRSSDTLSVSDVSPPSLFTFTSLPLPVPLYLFTFTSLPLPLLMLTFRGHKEIIV